MSVAVDAPLACPLDAPEAYRDTRGRWVTEGRRALIALPDKYDTIAATLRVTKQAIAKLVAGRSRPSPERMLALERHYGIRMYFWAIAPLEQRGAKSTNG